MRERHKHAELIHAWADGQEIQLWAGIDECWVRDVSPSWDERLMYRVKPETIKYRVALMKAEAGPWVSVAYRKEHETALEAQAQFVRWLGEWEEVKV